MIVKDEAAVIDRCLASVRDLIDHWVICDTGSSDDTRERIRAALSGIPGVLHEHAWVDFGHNRSRAIECARGTADHLLLLDADMELVTGPSFDPRRLGHGAGEGAETADGYLIRYEGSLDYRQVLLVRGDLPWKYVGVTHEYLDADVPYQRGQLDGLTIRHLADGANRADKFERDRRLLEAHLATTPDDSRAWFYLGQTHFDLGDWDPAIAAYERRLEMDGWDEELWVARYKIALARLHRGDDRDAVLGALLEVWQARPSRLEPLYVAARTAREAGDHHLGHLLSRPILDASYPSDILFVERDVYRYLLAFEHSICCYWVGRHDEAVRLCNGLLGLPDLPPAHREAVVRNRRFSLDLRAPAPYEDGAGEGNPRPRPRLLVVVPLFNPGVLLDRAVASLREQEPTGPAGFEVVLVDDGSTDGTGAALTESLPDGWSLLTQPGRLGAAAAVGRAVAEHARPGDVVVVLPGDGRLATPDALATVAATYAGRPCEATYGQHLRPGSPVGGARPFVDRADFDRFLAAEAGEPDAVGPLLTFRARLLEPVTETEPSARADRAGDDELARAVLARAGFDRIAFVDHILAEVSRFH